MQRLAGLRRPAGEAPGTGTAAHPAADRRGVAQGGGARYRALRTALDHEAGCLNADLGEPDWVPLRLRLRAPSTAAVAGYMRIARVGAGDAIARRHEPGREGVRRGAESRGSGRAGAVALRRRRTAAGRGAAGQPARPRRDGRRDGPGAARWPLAERQERWRAMWDGDRPTARRSPGAARSWRRCCGALLSITAGPPEPAAAPPAPQADGADRRARRRLGDRHRVDGRRTMTGSAKNCGRRCWCPGRAIQLAPATPKPRLSPFGYRVARDPAAISSGRRRAPASCRNCRR